MLSYYMLKGPQFDLTKPEAECFYLPIHVVVKVLQLN